MKTSFILTFVILHFSCYAMSQAVFDTALHKTYYRAITRTLERNVDVVADYRLHSFALIAIDINEYKVKSIETTAVDSVMLLFIDSSNLENLASFYTDLSKKYGYRDCIFIQPVSTKYLGTKTTADYIPDARILIPFYYGLEKQLKPRIMLDMIEIGLYDTSH